MDNDEVSLLKDEKVRENYKYFMRAYMDAYQSKKEREELEKELRGCKDARANLESEIVYLKHQIEYFKKKLESTERLLLQTSRSSGKS